MELTKTENITHKRHSPTALCLKQREIQKAFKAVKNSGSSIERFEVNPLTGIVTFICADQVSKSDRADEYASWNARRQ